MYRYVPYRQCSYEVGLYTTKIAKFILLLSTTSYDAECRVTVTTYSAVEESRLYWTGSPSASVPCNSIHVISTGSSIPRMKELFYISEITSKPEFACSPPNDPIEDIVLFFLFCFLFVCFE